MSEALLDFDRIWNYQEPAKTETAFLALLPHAFAANDPSYIGQLYTQLARTQSLQQKFDEAHVFLDKAKSLLKTADDITEVRYLLELGRTYNSAGDKSRAQVLFEEAWKKAQSIQADGYAVDAAHMMAITMNEPQNVLRWNLQALDYAQKSNQESAQKWLGSLYNNIAWTYFDLQDFAKALEVHEQGLSWQIDNGTANSIKIARWSVARIQRALGQIENALETQLQLLAQHQADDTEDMYVYEELAHCYDGLQNAEQSAIYARKAYSLMSADEWMVKHEPERLSALKDLL